MIKEIFIGKLLNETYDLIKSQLKKQRSTLIIKYSDFENILDKQITYITNWCSEISFIDTFQKKETIKTYVNLDYFLTPKRVHFFSDEKEKTKRLEEILEIENHNIIILGDPGAGKTTTLKYIAYKILYDENFFQSKFKFPLLIRLKELKKTESLVEKLANSLGIIIEVSESKNQINNYEILLTTIINAINQLNCVILLDGFDEINSQSLKNEVLTDIENLSINSEKTNFIITCRSADFYYNVSNSKIYEIKSLEKEQVEIFVNNWLKDSSKSEKLLKKIYSSPYQYYALKPLTLAHLCAIYERTGKIPEKPILLYKKYTELLLSDWDKQNRIERNSKYHEFDNETKLTFLSHIAFLSKIRYDVDYFEKDKIQNIYKEICQTYNLPKKEAISVINEIENHTGLFLQTGFNSFEFEHKTLQEYITSEYVLRNFKNISRENLNKLPNELAATLLLSEKPNELFLQFLSKLDFYSTYNQFFDDRRINRYLYTLNKYQVLSGGRRKLKDNILSYDELPITIKEYDFFNTFISRISIEKPDFEKNQELSFWLLGIYTIGSLFKIDKGQLELFSLNTSLYLETIFMESFFLDTIKNIERLYKIGLTKHEIDEGFPLKYRTFLPFVLKPENVELNLPRFIYLPIKSQHDKVNKIYKILGKKWYTEN